MTTAEYRTILTTGGPFLPVVVRFALDASNRVLFTVGGTFNLVSSPYPALTDGNWHLVTATWQKGVQMETYVDGVLVGSQVLTVLTAGYTATGCGKGCRPHTARCVAHHCALGPVSKS
jgi:hypothetical protein